MVTPPISESLNRSKNVPLGLSFRIRCRCCFPMNPNMTLVDKTIANACKCHRLSVLWLFRRLCSPCAPVGSQVFLSQLHRSLKPHPERELSTGQRVLRERESVFVLYSCARQHLRRRSAASTLLNWAQETIMLLNSSKNSGLSNIFWAKKCWLYWSRLWSVCTSDMNLLLSVLDIRLQGTRSGTTNGILSWGRRQRGRWAKSSDNKHSAWFKRVDV